MNFRTARCGSGPARRQASSPGDLSAVRCGAIVKRRGLGCGTFASERGRPVTLARAVAQSSATLAQASKSRAASGERVRSRPPAREFAWHSSCARQSRDPVLGDDPRCACGGGCPRCTARVPPIVHDVLRSPGTPLDHDTRQTMEGLLETNLGDVRVHTDAGAAASARAVGAIAYTFGNAIVFDRGRYAPQDPTGRTLLAHELVHTLQQRQSARNPAHGAGAALRIDVPNSPAEHEARSVAVRLSVAGALGVSRSRATARPAVSKPACPIVESPTSAVLMRTPGDVLSAGGKGTDELHGDLVERWRSAQGLPPFGRDPVTGQPVGPSDSEVRFDGLLDRWLLSNANSTSTVAAPTRPPAGHRPGHHVGRGRLPRRGRLRRLPGASNLCPEHPPGRGGEHWPRAVALFGGDPRSVSGRPRGCERLAAADAHRDELTDLPGAAGAGDGRRAAVHDLVGTARTDGLQRSAPTRSSSSTR